MFFHIKKNNLSGVFKNEGQNSTSEFFQCRPFFWVTFCQNLRKKMAKIPDVFHNFRSSFVEPQVGFSIFKFFQIQRFSATPNSYFFLFASKKLQNPDRNKNDKFEIFDGFWITYFAHCFSQRLRVQADIRASHFELNFVICSFQFWAQPWPTRGSSPLSLKYHYFGAKSTKF